MDCLLPKGEPKPCPKSGTFWTQDSLDDLVSARSKIMGAGVWAAARPDDRPVISFAGGLPIVPSHVPSLPSEELLRATRNVLERERREALQYGGTFGPHPLREAIAHVRPEREASRPGSRVCPSRTST